MDTAFLLAGKLSMLVRNKRAYADHIKITAFKKYNIFAFAARYPTVPLGRAMLRLGMTALHTEEDVALFIAAVRDISRQEVGPEVGEDAGNRA